MIDLQDIITTKRELLSRETYSRNPINYSAGMAEDQKDRYIQYLAEQNQDLRLTGDAMRLVLEDFMAQMKELKDQMSSMQSKHVDLENRLSEEHKLMPPTIKSYPSSPIRKARCGWEPSPAYMFLMQRRTS